MSPLLLAWIASITYGLYSVVAKLIGKYQLKNNYQFSFFLTLFGGIVTAVISYLNGGQLAANWTFIIFAAICLVIGNVLYLTALRVLDVSVMAPLFNVRVAISVFLGFLLLGESLSLRSLFFIAVIFIAGFFATMDEKFSVKSFFTKSIAVGLIFMLVLSVQSVLVNRAIDQTSYWTATLWMGLLASVFSFIFLYPKFKKDLAKTKPQNYMGVAILALIGGLGDLAAYKAFEGNVGISSVIISLPLSMVMAFALSMWRPKLMEKHSIKVYLVRFTAAAVMIWCALQLK
ncbi:MAG: DMT family transporter [Patescibacteria group bacterium]|jgi:drug/metabolite transporter (DMT)-like permease